LRSTEGVADMVCSLGVAPFRGAS
ncbi:MAG: hypothetical protein RL071_4706, partial [Pseudomonadota bacterium]